ncbi:MAG: hemerythrin-like domain-containing protein [Gammaproteobacteria bacterium]|jgi:hemerythrin-like domain-containing protein
MSEILDHIHEDHRNMVTLLDLLEGECRDLASGVDHDYTLMTNIVDYFNHYPTLYHHPFEDKVFAWICEERPTLTLIVKDLLVEHESQAKLVADVALLLKGIVTGHLVPRTKLVDELTSYITVQREHISKEENRLLKEVEGLLDGLHLAEIPMPDRAVLDPLFGEISSDEYSAIAVALGQSGSHPTRFEENTRHKH